MDSSIEKGKIGYDGNHFRIPFRVVSRTLATSRRSWRDQKA